MASRDENVGVLSQAWQRKGAWWSESDAGYRVSAQRVRQATVYTAWSPRAPRAGDDAYAQVCYDRLGHAGTEAQARELCEQEQAATA